MKIFSAVLAAMAMGAFVLYTVFAPTPEWKMERNAELRQKVELQTADNLAEREAAKPHTQEKLPAPLPLPPQWQQKSTPSYYCVEKYCSEYEKSVGATHTHTPIGRGK